jgi:hypothetical protein
MVEDRNLGHVSEDLEQLWVIIHKLSTFLTPL